MNKLFTTVALSLATLLAGCQSTGKHKDKPAIVLAAFGTSVPEAQAALENIDTQVREAYPDHEVYWAFTADFIINKLRKQGQTTLFDRKIPLMSTVEVYTLLDNKDVKNVVVQSLHVSPGQEYKEVINTPKGQLNISYGKPLLADSDCIAEFATVLSPTFGDKETVTILCGHGNDHHPEYNAQLVELDAVVRASYPNTFVATVEGQPGIEQAFADAKASGLKKVKFVPIMIVAGDHIMNDVIGAEPESWKNMLKMETSSVGGMGENEAIVQLFLSRLTKAYHQLD